MADESDVGYFLFNYPVGSLKRAGLERFGQNEPLRMLLCFLGETLKECHFFSFIRLVLCRNFYSRPVGIFLAGSILLSGFGVS